MPKKQGLRFRRFVLKVRYSRFWDWLVWVCFWYIFVWIILKMFGVIKTPIFLEYSPVLAAMYIAGKAVQKLDRATEDIKELQANTRRIENRVGSIDTHLTLVESDLGLIKRNCRVLSKSYC